MCEFFPTPPEKLRSSVLVVDDEPLIRWAVAESLGRVGYHVVEAEDARTAVQLVATTQPEVGLVILDLKLPDSSDLSLLHTIKRMSPHCAVIMMTAYGKPGLAEAALRDGARSVVGKPFDMQMLVGLVREALPIAH